MINNFKTFREISEQSDIVGRVIAHKDSEEMERLVYLIRETRNNAVGRIILIGAGTSYHACLFAEYYFAKHNDMLVNAYVAGEFDSFVHDLNAQSLVILASQSGETVDDIDIMRYIVSSGAKSIALTNDPDSTLGRSANGCTLIYAGEQNVVPATKTFLAEILTFAVISENLEGINLISDKKEQMIANIKNYLSENYQAKVRKVAEKIKDCEKIFILGKDLYYPLALETALKIEECSKIKAEGYSIQEFLHGHISTIDNKSAVIAFLLNDEHRENNLKIIEEIKKRGVKVIGVAESSDPIFDDYLELAPDPISSIVPMQILALELADIKGTNPDNPAGLSKVVKGV